MSDLGIERLTPEEAQLLLLMLLIPIELSMCTDMHRLGDPKNELAELESHLAGLVHKYTSTPGETMRGVSEHAAQLLRKLVKLGYKPLGAPSPIIVEKLANIKNARRLVDDI